LNANVLKVALTQFDDDLTMKGEIGYSTFFMNFDASTMEPQQEFDKNMTTIHVPEQKWG